MMSECTLKVLPLQTTAMSDIVDVSSSSRFSTCHSASGRLVDISWTVGRWSLGRSWLKEKSTLMERARSRDPTAHIGETENVL
jgi:hypothetical protein